MKPSVRFGLRLAVGGALITLILRRVSWEALEAVEPARLAFGVVAALLLLLAGQCVAARRWKILLGPGSPPWSYLARLYLIGTFFSLFLPTVVGGDAVRAVATAHSTSRTGNAVASVLLDRLFGVAAMMAYLVIGLLVAPELAQTMLGRAEWRIPGGLPLIAAAAAVLGIAAIVLVRRSARLSAVVKEGWTAIDALRRFPGRAVRALALGFAVQACYICLWIVLAGAMRFDLPVATFLLAVPLVTLGTMLPISLAGLGLREGAWLLLLRNAAIPDAQIVAYSLLYFAANLMLGALGGVLLAFRGTGLGGGTPSEAAPSGESSG